MVTQFLCQLLVTQKFALWPSEVDRRNFGTQVSLYLISSSMLLMPVACENIRFSSFFVYGDISRGGTSFLLALRLWGRFARRNVVPPRETSPAAKSDEKRMFSQAIMPDKLILVKKEIGRSCSRHESRPHCHGNNRQL